MKRFKYGLNNHVTQSSNFGELVCLGITDVNPGETISGTSAVKLLSESATKPILNRTYHDVYAFYVPYRLVWDEWPDFIAGDSPGPIPTLANVANSYQQCLNGRGGLPNTAFNAFGCRAYNLIWNKFFRTQEAARS
jgi:hypothetical protein